MIPPLTDAIAAHPYLRLALWSLVPILAGTLLRRLLPFLGGALRVVGQAGLFLALVMSVLPMLHLPLDSGPLAPDQPQLTVSGADTRVPMADDGHFWVEVRANHKTRRLLVDTGATLTTLSVDAANELGAVPVAHGGQIILTTANGKTRATLGLMGSLRVGNVVVHHLPVVVAPGIANINVLGMNFLSQLAGWRVEGRTLILVPRHPQVNAKP